MKVVYRFLGLGGGDWRVVGLVSGENTRVTPIDLKYSGLSGIKEAIRYSSEAFSKRISSFSASSPIDMFTNAGQNVFLNEYPTDDIDNQINLTANYTPENLPETDEIWLVSDFIWSDARYNINPLSSPKPPFTVYTDASYWPNYKDGRSSIGFAIQGSNNGSFIMGMPVTDSIKDNNVAEYYAVRSALLFLPTDSRVEIKTDSRNVKDILNDETRNPKFRIVPKLRQDIESYRSLSLEHVERKWTTIADGMADIGKTEPILIGEPPQIK